MTQMSDPGETSLSKLSQHDWNILSNRHSRGLDWTVTKVGKKWQVQEIFGQGLFATKKAAADAIDTLILWEARRRAYLRIQATTYEP